MLRTDRKRHLPQLHGTNLHDIPPPPPKRQHCSMSVKIRNHCLISHSTVHILRYGWRSKLNKSKYNQTSFPLLNNADELLRPYKADILGEKLHNTFEALSLTDTDSHYRPDVFHCNGWEIEAFISPDADLLELKPLFSDDGFIPPPPPPPPPKHLQLPSSQEISHNDQLEKSLYSPQRHFSDDDFPPPAPSPPAFDSGKFDDPEYLENQNIDGKPFEPDIHLPRENNTEIESYLDEETEFEKEERLDIEKQLEEHEKSILILEKYIEELAGADLSEKEKMEKELEKHEREKHAIEKELEHLRKEEMDYDGDEMLLKKTIEENIAYDKFMDDEAIDDEEMVMSEDEPFNEAEIIESPDEIDEKDLEEDLEDVRNEISIFREVLTEDGSFNRVLYFRKSRFRLNTVKQQLQKHDLIEEYRDACNASGFPKLPNKGVHRPSDLPQSLSDRIVNIGWNKLKKPLFNGVPINHINKNIKRREPLISKSRVFSLAVRQIETTNPIIKHNQPGHRRTRNFSGGANRSAPHEILSPQEELLSKFCVCWVQRPFHDQNCASVHDDFVHVLIEQHHMKYPAIKKAIKLYFDSCRRTSFDHVVNFSLFKGLLFKMNNKKPG